MTNTNNVTVDPQQTLDDVQQYVNARVLGAASRNLTWNTYNDNDREVVCFRVVEKNGLSPFPGYVVEVDMSQFGGRVVTGPSPVADIGNVFVNLLQSGLPTRELGQPYAAGFLYL